MDFTLSEEQQLIKDSVERFVREEYGLEQRRKLVASDDGFSRDHWAKMAELGWLGVSLPEEYGGFDGGPVATMILMEALGAGCRAVVVPYAGGVETEQTLRAKRLAERTPLDIISEADLTAERLAAGIDRALAAPPLASGVVDMKGAATTVSLIRKWANQASGSSPDGSRMLKH